MPLNMPLNRSQIAALIPHGNSMCMLDEVISWDDVHIHCRSKHFSANTNPLIESNTLETVLLIEYAAQAAAVHIGLLQSPQDKIQPAYIGAVKNLELLKPLRENGMFIDIEAHCLLSTNNGAIYDVIVQQQDEMLMRGRLILNQT